MQRRLTQLELAARQLADETEEHAQERLAEIERGNGAASPQAGQPPRAVGSGKARPRRRRSRSAQQLDRGRAGVRPARRGASRKSSRPARLVGESDYQRLYELDVSAKQAAEATRRDQKPVRTARPAEEATAKRRLLAPGSRPRGNRRGRQRLDRHPRHPDDGDRTGQAAGAGRAAAPARGRPGRGGRGRRQRRPPQPQRPAGPQPADRLVHLPAAPPASARPSSARRWPR